jgi:hypothetical protein
LLTIFLRGIIKIISPGNYRDRTRGNSGHLDLNEEAIYDEREVPPSLLYPSFKLQLQWVNSRPGAAAPGALSCVGMDAKEINFILDAHIYYKHSAQEVKLRSS